MSFVKPLIVKQGRVEQLQAGDALDAAGLVAALPDRAHFHHLHASVVAGHAVVRDGNGYTFHQQPAAVNDSVQTSFVIRGGSYDFLVYVRKGDDSGILTVVIDNATIGTLNLYASSDTDVVLSLTGILLDSGLHSLRLSVASKSGSSSGYAAHLADYWFVPHVDVSLVGYFAAFNHYVNDGGFYYTPSMITGYGTNFADTGTIAQESGIYGTVKAACKNKTPIVVFSNNTNGNLTHVYRSETSWSSPVDFNGSLYAGPFDVASFDGPSDEDGSAHCAWVAYPDGGTASLRYAEIIPGSSGITEDIYVHESVSGAAVFITQSSTGNVAVAWANASGIYYSERVGGSWTSPELVASGTYQLNGACRPAGTQKVAIFCISGTNLNRFTYNGSAWSSATVASNSSGFWYVAVANVSGVPTAAYLTLDAYDFDAHTYTIAVDSGGEAGGSVLVEMPQYTPPAANGLSSFAICGGEDGALVLLALIAGLGVTNFYADVYVNGVRKLRTPLPYAMDADPISPSICAIKPGPINGTPPELL